MYLFEGLGHLKGKVSTKSSGLAVVWLHFDNHSGMIQRCVRTHIPDRQ
jgi:hypothetical protein